MSSATALLPIASAFCYALGMVSILLDLSGAMLGTVTAGSLTYASAFLILLGALVHALANRDSSRQGGLRVLALAVVVPLALSALGLVGEQVLIRFEIVSQPAPNLPAAAILLTTAVVLACVVACANALPAPGRAPRPGEAAPNVRLLTLTVLDATLVSCAAALGLWFFRSGVVPMLYRGNIDEMRFALANRPEFSLYSRFIYVGSVALAVRLALFAGGARTAPRLERLPTAVICLPVLIGLVLFASKYLYVYPLGVALLSYNRFRAPLRVFRPRVLVAVLLFLYAMVFVTNLRGLGRLVGNSLVADVFVALPEYRDMAQIVAIADELGMHVTTYDQLVWSGIPSEVAGAFGQVRKGTPDDAYVYKRMLGYTFAGGSTRIGIMGELFLNSRLIGVALGVGALGLLLAFLDRVTAGWRWNGFGPVLALALCIQLLWLFQSELTTNLPITYLFLYYLALLAIVNGLPHSAPNRDPLNRRDA